MSSESETKDGARTHQSVDSPACNTCWLTSKSWCPDGFLLLIPPSVHFQETGVQQTLLQHLHQDLHVCAVPAGLPAVAALEAAVHRLSETPALCVCK